MGHAIRKHLDFSCSFQQTLRYSYSLQFYAYFRFVQNSPYQARTWTRGKEWYLLADRGYLRVDPSTATLQVHLTDRAVTREFIVYDHVF